MSRTLYYWIDQHEVPSAKGLATTQADSGRQRHFVIHVDFLFVVEVDREGYLVPFESYHIGVHLVHGPDPIHC